MRAKANHWPTKALGKISKIQSGGTPDRKNRSYWSNGDIPWVTTAEVKFRTIIGTAEKITSAGLANSSAKVFPKGAILLALYGQGKTRGQVALLGIDAATNQACAAIQAKPELDSGYLYEFLKGSYSAIRNLSNTGGQENLSATIISEIQVPLPPLPEQRKIAEILRTWDLGLEKLEALRAANLRRRIWMRSHLFTGRSRLPGFSGEWGEVALGDVLTEHGLQGTGAEEVFSVSVHKGLINQIEHLGRSFAAAETSHYNRVLPGDIVYTKSPTGDFPLGIIKQSKISQEVIVSPLYGVFTPATRELGVILDSLFESPLAVRNYLHPLVQKGAKNTIAITNRRFLEGRLRLPMDPAEQAAIAAVVEVSQAELNAIVSEMDLLTRQKRGLMQKLLTGEWRVKVEEAA
ncbi:restriction endonuclease subunit S [Sphingopyxis granuli]|uniref:restriction endonuclease subunit S n=1 Tax=Sphingopyxis granuli TaxID=267128 RepID=UPI001F53AA11|nr:restriction endonuclease subunit S [Sphingopyxis granuli]UNK78060.1 restriction endonuclease subunit S [Sphingopyxis granuli]